MRIGILMLAVVTGAGLGGCVQLSPVDTSQEITIGPASGEPDHVPVETGPLIMDDQDIRIRVNAAVADLREVGPNDIRATVQNGIVTLRGTASRQTAADAVMIVQGVEGVLEVRNELMAPPTGATAAPSAPAGP